MATTVGLDINALATPENRVVIASSAQTPYPYNFRVEGFLMSEPRFYSRSQWNDSLEDQLMASMDSYMQQGARALNTVTGSSMSPPRVRAFQNSMKNWSGTQDLQLQLDLLFFSKVEGDDVRVPVKSFIAATLPVVKQGSAVSSITSGKVTEMMAPLGYTPASAGSGNSTSGVFTIVVGNWLFIDNFMLLQDVNFAFSKELLYPDGRPLYAVGSVNFTSVRMVTKDEFELWFQNSKDDSDRRAQNILRGGLL